MIAVFCDTYSGSGITLKSENGPYHEDGRYLSGDGTDDTTVIPSGIEPMWRWWYKRGFS